MGNKSPNKKLSDDYALSGTDPRKNRKSHIYDGPEIIADYKMSVLTNSYITPELDHCLSYSNNDQKLYFSHDGIQNINNITDSMGNLIVKYDYTAFGIRHAKSRNSISDQRYGFQGREHHSSYLAINFRTRNYVPTYGRFLSRDSWLYNTNKEGNLYQFVDSNPIVNKDPFGLMTIDECRAMLGNDDSRIRDFWKKFVNFPNCPPPTVLCSDQCPPKTGGHYIKGTSMILVCANNKCKNEPHNYNETVTHEAVHYVQDQCLGIRRSGSCEDEMCNEIQAYSLQHYGSKYYLDMPLTEKEIKKAIKDNLTSKEICTPEEFDSKWDRLYSGCAGFIGPEK